MVPSIFINIELKKVRLKFNNLLEKRREKLIKQKDIIINKIKTRENQVIKSPTNSKTLIKEDPLWKNYDEIKKRTKSLQSKIDQLFLKKILVFLPGTTRKTIIP